METKNGEAKADEGKVVTTEPVTAPPAQSEAENLKAKLAEAEKALESARQEALAHQRNVSKKDKELNQYKKLDALSEKIDLIAQYLPDFVAQTEELGEKPKPKPDVVSKLKEVDQKYSKVQAESEYQRILAIASEADRMIQPLGLNMKATPELREAYLKFLEGDPEAGLEETRKVVKAMEVKKQEKPITQKSEAEIRKEMEQEIRKKIYEEHGWNVSDAGKPSAPSGKIYSLKEVQAMPPSEISKLIKETGKSLLQLQQEGRIK